jgi:hypothetical protein
LTKPIQTTKLMRDFLDPMSFRTARHLAIATLGIAASVGAAKADTLTFNTSTLAKVAQSPASQQFPVDMETFSGSVPTTPTAAFPFDGSYNGTRYQNLGNGAVTDTLPGFNPFGTGMISWDSTLLSAGVARVNYSSPSPANVGDADTFSRPLNTQFLSFYLVSTVPGDCLVCGPSNAVATVLTTAADNRVRGGFTGTLNGGSYTILDNAPINIVYGASGIAGTLSFSAITSFANDVAISNTGRIILTAVPGPLPLAGAVFAFGWSKKLRRRIKRASLA